MSGRDLGWMPAGLMPPSKRIYTRGSCPRSKMGVPMYAKTLRNHGHTRRFTIRNTGSSGWEVLHEHDSVVIKSARYDDWHRVERAKAVFAVEASMLCESGWVEA